MKETNKPQRIALIVSAFPPQNISGALQLRDLSEEFVRQGYCPTVMVPSNDIKTPWELENLKGVQVLRLKTLKIRDISYVRRTFGELLLSFMMLRNIRKSPLSDVNWDGIVWYSPTIFFGPLVKVLKKESDCKSYLILRDIFPDWAVDLGLMSRGLIYKFFKFFERYQYAVANVIGVQSASNMTYFDHLVKQDGKRIEVLHNWLAKSPNVGSSFSVSKTRLDGKLIFVYAGNMGIAQGMEILIDLAESLGKRNDIGFLFVGRGNNFEKLSAQKNNRMLDNVIFHDEIPAEEIPGLFSQCHFGLIALDKRHNTHNIPGKFLSYMHAGLPVLATINQGNDLGELIISSGVGHVCMDNSLETLKKLAEEIVDEISSGKSFSKNCHTLSEKLFTPKTAAKQIFSALEI